MDKKIQMYSLIIKKTKNQLAPIISIVNYLQSFSFTCNISGIIIRPNKLEGGNNKVTNRFLTTSTFRNNGEQSLHPIHPNLNNKELTTCFFRKPEALP